MRRRRASRTASDLIDTYKVKSGDTLVGIAHQFSVSMMTLWWANKLTSKDELHVGQALTIPPVSGLVVTVRRERHARLARGEYKVDPSRDRRAATSLEDPTLVVGQTLVLPGATGARIPTPKPTPEPSRTAQRHDEQPRRRSAPAVTYSGGRLLWPVVGGNNYISQYFHYGH